jgi:hypothetical protein
MKAWNSARLYRNAMVHDYPVVHDLWAPRKAWRALTSTIFPVGLRVHQIYTITFPQIYMDVKAVLQAV